MERYRASLKVMFVIIVTAVITLSCGSPEQRAEKIINTYMQKTGTVGLSVAVVKDNKIIYTHAFGMSNIEKQTDLRTDDIFRIASISKSFTTTALLTLVEKGAVSLDSDVSDIIGFKIRNPKYPEVPITVKMLLSHSSSLNDSQEYYSLDFINPAVNPDFAKCYNDYMPGTKYEYCNLGFNTLGTIVEKVSGIRFDKYVSQNVLQPLNLKASFNVDDFKGITFTTLYTPDTTGLSVSGKINFIPSESAYLSRAPIIDSGKYIQGYSAPLFSPTGGMKISAPDLAKYMMMHMNYGIEPQSGVRIIKEETSKMMQTPVIETGGEGKYCFALNQITNLIPGETMTGHTGSAYGLLSAMYFQPEKEIRYRHDN
ncbi:MAG: beta-lactamase family protein [Bacteroidetes bacterium]|nr:beta-lactamase family protein [Bacteroidota bacterium]